MKKAFTLAEIMVVVVVLGIIAAITVPQIVKRQIEASNRSKIKKAMSVYDFLMNKVITENNIRSNVSLQQYGENCENTSPKFKAVDYAENENAQKNICRFKTTDGVWWDISDLLNPTIALNKDDLNNKDNATTFNFNSGFDDEGVFRVNDIGHNKTDELTKLYNYIQNKKSTKTPLVGAQKDIWKTYSTNCYKKEEHKACSEPIEMWVTMDDGYYMTFGFNVYDEQGNLIAQNFGCDIDRNCYIENYAIADGKGGFLTLWSDEHTEYEKTHPNEETYKYNEEYKYLYNSNERGDLSSTGVPCDYFMGYCYLDRRADFW